MKNYDRVSQMTVSAFVIAADDLEIMFTRGIKVCGVAQQL
jgi:hypothetical protein